MITQTLNAAPGNEAAGCAADNGTAGRSIGRNRTWLRLLSLGLMARPSKPGHQHHRQSGKPEKGGTL